MPPGTTWSSASRREPDSESRRVPSPHAAADLPVLPFALEGRFAMTSRRWILLVIGAAVVAVGVAIALFGPTFPSGRYLRVRDPAEVALALEIAVASAWLKSGRTATEGIGLEASVRRFWIQPSWTITCELSVELRLRDARGAVLWQQDIDSRVQAFEGFFLTEAFERVARMALDQFADRAAAAFASPDFAAAAGPNAGFIDR